MKKLGWIVAVGLWGQETTKPLEPSAEEKVEILTLERDALELSNRKASVPEMAKREEERLQKLFDEKAAAYSAAVDKVKVRMKLAPACRLEKGLTFTCPAPEKKGEKK